MCFLCVVAPFNTKLTEESGDKDWLETVQKLDQDKINKTKPKGGPKEMKPPEGIVLYNIIQGLDYTPMLGLYQHQLRSFRYCFSLDIVFLCVKSN